MPDIWNHARPCWLDRNNHFSAETKISLWLLSRHNYSALSKAETLEAEDDMERARR